jgi:phosphoribosylanthranilate isomerase
MSKIKICGLSREEDIYAVNRAMPDYIGFVFAPSRRQVSIGQAAKLKKILDRRIKAVGVFVNENMDTVLNLIKEGVIDIAQLHGDEGSQYIKAVKSSCGCKVIKSVSVGESLPELPESADYLLFDTLSGQLGGAGKIFDWGKLKNVAPGPYFLAGGLSCENVLNAINLLNPYCVDVSSGVETDGKKDAEKIFGFIRLVRGEI